jgi:GNAT superfamily N-acetyltransferase
MKKKITRFFLEINSEEMLKPSKCFVKNLSLMKEKKKDKDLPKFLYREIGKDYYWKDRLIWNDDAWIKLISNPLYGLYTLFYDRNLIGYFELISDSDKNFEIAYFGIFKDFYGKKIGGFLLTSAIKISFANGAKRVWVHTCTLDHPNALKNYIARGMKVFRSEELNID